MTTFQVVEGECPAGVVDRLLWRDAQHILRRHPDQTDDGMCVWCGRQWPCGPRRLAERAEIASYGPAGVPWTAYDEPVRRRVRPSANDRRPPGERPTNSSALSGRMVAANAGRGRVTNVATVGGRATDDVAGYDVPVGRHHLVPDPT